MVAERGSVNSKSSSIETQENSRSSSTNLQNIKKYRIPKRNLVELFGSDSDENNSSKRKFCNADRKNICTNEKPSVDNNKVVIDTVKNRACVELQSIRSVLESDLSVSSSDDDLISFDSREIKNFKIEIENELNKKPSNHTHIDTKKSTIDNSEICESNSLESAFKRKKFEAQRNTHTTPRLKSQIVRPKPEIKLKHFNREKWQRQPQQFNNQFRDRQQRNWSTDNEIRSDLFPNPPHRLGEGNINSRKSFGHSSAAANSWQHNNFHQANFGIAPPIGVPSTSRQYVQSTPSYSLGEIKNNTITLSVETLINLINKNQPKKKQSHGQLQRKQRAIENKFKREHGQNAWYEKYGQYKKK